MTRLVGQLIKAMGLNYQKQLKRRLKRHGLSKKRRMSSIHRKSQKILPFWMTFARKLRHFKLPLCSKHNHCILHTYTSSLRHANHGVNKNSWMIWSRIQQFHFKSQQLLSWNIWMMLPHNIFSLNIILMFIQNHRKEDFFFSVKWVFIKRMVEFASRDIWSKSNWEELLNRCFSRSSKVNCIFSTVTPVI